MSNYNQKLYPEPDKKDALKMKEFFKLKYTQKRFAKTANDSDSDDNSDEDSKNNKIKTKKVVKK